MSISLTGFVLELVYPVIIGSSSTNLDLEEIKKKNSMFCCDYFNLQLYSLYYRHAVFLNLKYFWFYISIKIILGFGCLQNKATGKHYLNQKGNVAPLAAKDCWDLKDIFQCNKIGNSDYLCQETYKLGSFLLQQH